MHELNLQDLRNKFGLVSQEAAMFSGIIHDNIGFAIPDENLILLDVIVAAVTVNVYDII